MEVLQAQSRETIANLRADLIEAQHRILTEVVKRLNDLKDGEPGASGARGEPGTPGGPGERGERGEAGPRGDPGEVGRNGADGIRGEPGTPGERGERGEPGPRSDPGEPGRNGADGARGEPGQKGERGETGAKGERGDRGEQGQSGPAGERGERGETGPRGLVARVAAWSDRVFYEGDLVMHAGSCWQACCDTAKEPGAASDWQMIAAAGTPGLSFHIRGTYSSGETYRALDVVTLDHSWFIAKSDDPGVVPGANWQSGPVGKRGEKGLPGDKGPKGDPGKPAPHWIGVKFEDYALKAVMSDGTLGPTVSLAPLFERFEAELRGR